MRRGRPIHGANHGPEARAYRKALRAAEQAAWDAALPTPRSPAVRRLSALDSRQSLQEEARTRLMESSLLALGALAGVTAIATNTRTAAALVQNWDALCTWVRQVVG